MKTPRDPRFIPIEGSLNFRDFGGYRSKYGGRVKKGKLFRCGALSEIPSHAYSEFEALDIGIICDLRKKDERKFAQTPLAQPFSCSIQIPIAPGSSIQLQQSFQETSIDTETRIAFMKQVTREIARDHAQQYQQLFSALLSVESGFLLHCSAGKDRTGFGAAIILLHLGVSEDDVFDDYLLTNEADELLTRMAPKFKEKYGDKVDDENLKIIAGVKLEYLQAALNQVDETFGSLDDYLATIGIDQDAQEKLRSRLLGGQGES